MALTGLRREIFEAVKRSEKTMSGIARAVGADRANTSKRIRGTIPLTIEQAEAIARECGFTVGLIPTTKRARSA